MIDQLARAFFFVVTGLFLTVLLCILPFAWLLRDGLGPSSVASSGLEAVMRCMTTFYVGPALAVLVVLVIGSGVFCKVRSKPRPPELPE